MKRYCLLALMLLSLNTGCIFGRSDGRPGFFTNMYNRVHGVNTVGAPCASGMCGQPMPAPPMMPPVAMAPQCDGCGGATTSLGYPEYSVNEYPSYETVTEPGISSEVISPIPSSAAH